MRSGLWVRLVERLLYVRVANATEDGSLGALRDRASTVWRGMIRVENEAQQTNAYQENRNLMLSPKAHADSIPGLEILANDVRCPTPMPSKA
jgi:Fe-S cluster assembly protein SufD